MESIASKSRSIAAAVGVCTVLCACSAQNNPLLGRVEAAIDQHQVVVMNCRTNQLPKVQSTVDGDSWTPCKGSTVVIKNGLLYVNGESFGQLAPGDRVLVKDGRATIEPGR